VRVSIFAIQINQSRILRIWFSHKSRAYCTFAYTHVAHKHTHTHSLNQMSLQQLYDKLYNIEDNWHRGLSDYSRAA